MIIEPRTRGFICLTAHPTGCEQNVVDQIAYVKSKGKINGAKKVLVIGSIIIIVCFYFIFNDCLKFFDKSYLLFFCYALNHFLYK